MIKILCLCVDDTNKPDEIPEEKWIVKDQEYHITLLHPIQFKGGVNGCDLAEIDISDYEPYSHFRLSRFVIQQRDLPLYVELVNFSKEYHKIDKELDLNKYINEL